MELPPLDKRIYVKGLSLECPLGKAEDCPLNSLRVLPVAQMNKTVNDLTHEQIDSIMAIHRHCFAERTTAGQSASAAD